MGQTASIFIMSKCVKVEIECRYMLFKINVEKKYKSKTEKETKKNLLLQEFTNEMIETNITNELMCCIEKIFSENELLKEKPIATSQFRLNVNKLRIRMRLNKLIKAFPKYENYLQILNNIFMKDDNTLLTTKLEKIVHNETEPFKLYLIYASLTFNI